MQTSCEKEEKAKREECIPVHAIGAELTIDNTDPITVKEELEVDLSPSMTNVMRLLPMTRCMFPKPIC